MLHWPCFRAAGRVAQKRPRANGGISKRGVGNQGSRTNRRVEVPLHVAPEGKPTNRRIECAGGEAKKGVLPFGCVPSGIAAVRRRNDCLLRSAEAQTVASVERNGGEGSKLDFHRREFPSTSRGVSRWKSTVLIIAGIGDPGAQQRVLTRDTGIGDAGYSKAQAGLPASLQANRMLSIKRVLPKKTPSSSTLVRSSYFNWLQRFCIGDFCVIDSCQVRFIDNPLRERDDIVGRFFIGIFGR